MSWIILFFAGLFEVGWAVGLKYTEGFSKPLPTVLTALAMLVSLGLLGLAMPPMQAAALLIVPSMVTNLWQLACGPRFLGLMKRLAGLLLGVVVGTLLVGAWLGGDAPRQATGVLGLALAAYALLGLAAIPLHLPARHEPWAGPLVGLATGALTAVTGVFVIPAVPYLGALRLQRDELVQALGLSFSASTLALAVTLGVHGDLLEPQKIGRASCRERV